jgi:hypothetical protein
MFAAEEAGSTPNVTVDAAQPIAPRIGTPELHMALEVVMVRLAPIDQMAEKLHVLQTLSRGAPEPVAEILQLLAEDVSRFAAY